MELRALDTRDIPALAKLGRREEVVRYGDHDRGAEIDCFAAWIGAPEPDARLAVGAFDGDALVAAARLRLVARRRITHAASLELMAPWSGAEAPARALVEALVETADDWLQLRRITAVAPAEHEYVTSVFAGFAPEGVSRGSVERDGGLADEVHLARVDPSLRSANGGPPFSLPDSGPPLELPFSPVTEEDGAAMARLLSDPRVCWGTLQTPFQRRDLWSSRFSDNDPERVRTIGARLDGELVAAGSLVRSEAARRRHVASIGMMIAPEVQGRTLGRQLLDALLEVADEWGVSRIELEVWHDNERARRLYESRGFVQERVERAVGYRLGEYVDDIAMART